MATLASIRERSKASSNGAANHDDSSDQREANGYGSTYASHVTVLLIAAAILLRLLVGLHSYSGEMRWSLMLIMQPHALYAVTNQRSSTHALQVRDRRRALETTRRSATGWSSRCTRQSVNGESNLNICMIRPSPPTTCGHRHSDAGTKASPESLLCITLPQVHGYSGQ